MQVFDGSIKTKRRVADPKTDKRSSALMNWPLWVTSLFIFPNLRATA